MDQRYFDLLKKKEELGKYWNWKNNPEEIKEFAVYRESFSHHFRWEQRLIHFELIKMYLDRKITIDQYGSQLDLLDNKVIKLAEELELNLEKLETFEYNSNTRLFSETIDYVTGLYLCSYEANPDLRDEDFFDMSEEQFRESLKSQLLIIEQFREE